jgi:hypothetical protein
MVFNHPIPPPSFVFTHDPISMVGRVPSKDPLKHLSDARLNPKLDVVVVAMTCDPEASEDERGWWNGMIISGHVAKEHSKRDRQLVWQCGGCVSWLELASCRPG